MILDLHIDADILLSGPLQYYSQGYNLLGHYGQKYFTADLTSGKCLEGVAGHEPGAHVKLL